MSVSDRFARAVRTYYRVAITSRLRNLSYKYNTFTIVRWVRSTSVDRTLNETRPPPSTVSLDRYLFVESTDSTLSSVHRQRDPSDRGRSTRHVIGISMRARDKYDKDRRCVGCVQWYTGHTGARKLVVSVRAPNGTVGNVHVRTVHGFIAARFRRTIERERETGEEKKK
uniref:Uncharacterized protein n=1 Tax=Sipha flava TaxID=143950 RepID=A0A2S2QRR9_9HEMI